MALRAMLPQWFPRVNDILQLIGSHNLLAVASSAMLADPGLRPRGGRTAGGRMVDRFLTEATD